MCPQIPNTHFNNRHSQMVFAGQSSGILCHLIMGDCTLDEITNTHIFCIKQCTLPWYFDIAHYPAKSNAEADTTSRHPVAKINSLSIPNLVDWAFVLSVQNHISDFTSISWTQLVQETAKDPVLSQLSRVLSDGFNEHHRARNPELAVYLTLHHSLFVENGVAMYNNRAVIPTNLWDSCLSILHSAHQGVSGMESRALFWPGMNGAITYTRSQWRDCNQNAPSQQALLPSASHSPTTPFKQVFADYFDFAGHHYLLEGWVEIFRAPHSTAYSGASGLVATLRSAFATFGVPEEISSDGGPEFIATTTDKFFKTWNIHHRRLSAYFPKSNGIPKSNGRVEVAIKKCKRLLMDNIGPTASLNQHKLLRALLQVRNTPDPDCSPAEIVFGRQLRDAFTFLKCTSKFTNSHVRPALCDAWKKKEGALRMCFTRFCESLRHP